MSLSSRVPDKWRVVENVQPHVLPTGPTSKDLAMTTQVAKAVLKATIRSTTATIATPKSPGAYSKPNYVARMTSMPGLRHYVISASVQAQMSTTCTSKG